MRVTGSLQTKRGIYQMMTRVIFDDGTEKQKSRTTGLRSDCKNKREARKNKLAADQMLAEYIHELETEYDGYSKRSFLSAIDEWMEHKKLELRLDTYESYQGMLSAHIRPYFEPRNLQLNQVSAKILAKYADDKLAEGLTANSIRKHFVIFNGVFKHYIKYEGLVSNPAANISIRDQKEPFEGQAYTSDLAKKLLQSIHGDPIEPAVYLGLYLGLRRSEVVGLRWKDVDFSSNIVHVRNTIVRYSSVSEQERTKNATSKRDLYLPTGLKNYLSNRKNFPGEENSETFYICSRSDGRPFEPNYISHRFRKVLERNGLPVIRFHDLRHTAGSLLVNQGHTIKQVQEFLGHEKASTTLDIYTHISLEGKRNTAQVLDELLA